MSSRHLPEVGQLRGKRRVFLSGELAVKAPAASKVLPDKIRLANPSAAVERHQLGLAGGAHRIKQRYFPTAAEKAI
jgi:hypothetical protein